MGTKGVQTTNALLDDLSREDHRRVLPHLTRVDLTLAEVLSDGNASTQYVYFPNSGLIATHVQTVGRTSLSLVGKEGMVGSSLGAGFMPRYARIVVQGAGTAMRMEAQRFQQLAGRSISLQLQLHRYTYELLKRASQTAICNSFHTIEARLARCLLEVIAQANSDEIFITQQSLSFALAARRSGVSVAATSMRRLKLIEYSRGRVRILNPRGLKRVACQCYKAIGI